MESRGDSYIIEDLLFVLTLILLLLYTDLKIDKSISNQYVPSFNG